MILLRLRHLYAAGEGGPKSSELGKPVTLSLAELFAPRYKVTSAVEYTLDGVTPLAERERTRLRWQQAKPAQPSEEPAAVVHLAPSATDLDPQGCPPPVPSHPFSRQNTPCVNATLV